MAEIDATTEYTIVKVDQAAAQMGRTFRVVDRSLSIIALGVLGYGFCMMYELVSDFGGKLTEAVEGVTTGVPVPEEVFSDQGFAALEEHYKSKGWLRYRLWLRSYEEARRVHGVSGGMIRALPSGAAQLEEWQRIIGRVMPGLIPREKITKLNVVDSVVGRVLNNRATYFGVVGGLALLPAVPAVGSILRSSMKDE